MTQALYSLAEEIGRRLLERRHKLVTAESCTGGWLAKCVTDIAGSSEWFDRGFVTYSNQAKMEMLGVPEAELIRYGAVSPETVQNMALGALRNSAAQLAIAVSGIAGPGGGTLQKPVGTVLFAWQMEGEPCRTEARQFSGNRNRVREHAVKFALQVGVSLYAGFHK